MESGTLKYQHLPDRLSAIGKVRIKLLLMLEWPSIVI